jgi:hypothetical protein
LTTTTPTPRPRRLVTFAATVAVLLVSPMGPSAAWANGPNEMTTGELSATVEVTPRCPEKGFDYEVTLHNPPHGATWDNQAHWREAGQVVHHIASGDSGFVDSGEGTFEVRAVARQFVNGHHVTVHESDWTSVNVFCPGFKDKEHEDPEPTVTVELDGVCEPDTGVSFEIDFHDGPNVPVAYRALWRELPVGDGGSKNGQAAVIPTSEGTFEVIGLVKATQFPFSSWTSEPAVVTVDCSEPTTVDPGEDGPRRGTPDFTG